MLSGDNSRPSGIPAHLSDSWDDCDVSPLNSTQNDTSRSLCINASNCSSICSTPAFKNSTSCENEKNRDLCLSKNYGDDFSPMGCSVDNAEFTNQQARDFQVAERSGDDQNNALLNGGSFVAEEFLRIQASPLSVMTSGCSSYHTARESSPHVTPGSFRSSSRRVTMHDVSTDSYRTASINDQTSDFQIGCASPLLVLNFDYTKKRPRLHIASRNTEITEIESSDSGESLLPVSEHPYQSSSFGRQMRKRNKERDFVKFFSVQGFIHPEFVDHLYQCLGGHEGRKEAEEVYAQVRKQVMDQRFSSPIPPRKSSSDKTFNSSSRKKHPLKRLVKLLKNKSETLLHPNQTKKRKSSERKSCKGQYIRHEPSEFPSLSHPRFDYTRNMSYLHVAAQEFPEFTAILYIKHSPKPNLELAHIKTELIVATLKSFFHQLANIHTIWVLDLEGPVSQLIVEKRLKSRLRRLTSLARYEAALVLCRDGGIMMRHHKLCLLQSLADVLQIKLNQLLILSE